MCTAETTFRQRVGCELRAASLRPGESWPGAGAQQLQVGSTAASQPLATHLSEPACRRRCEAAFLHWPADAGYCVTCCSSSACTGASLRAVYAAVASGYALEACLSSSSCRDLHDGRSNDKLKSERMHSCVQQISKSTASHRQETISSRSCISVDQSRKFISSRRQALASYRGSEGSERKWTALQTHLTASTLPFAAWFAARLDLKTSAVKVSGLPPPSTKLRRAGAA